MPLGQGRPFAAWLAVLMALALVTALSASVSAATEPWSEAQFADRNDGQGDLAEPFCDEICMQAEQPPALLPATPRDRADNLRRGRHPHSGAADPPGKGPPHRPPIG